MDRIGKSVTVMKKEKILTHTVVEVYCDVCDEEARYACVGCHRDVCREHATRPEYGLFSNDYLGDYRDTYCLQCFEQALLLGEQVNTAHALRDTQIEALKNQWREAIKPWTKEV